MTPTIVVIKDGVRTVFPDRYSGERHDDVFGAMLCLFDAGFGGNETLLRGHIKAAHPEWTRDRINEEIRWRAERFMDHWHEGGNN